MIEIKKQINYNLKLPNTFSHNGQDISVVTKITPLEYKTNHHIWPSINNLIHIASSI